MIVLDTNIVSALMSGRRHPTAGPVREWIGTQPTHDLFVTTVTYAEIHAGVALLPYGARQDLLREAAEKFFAVMEPNILDFTRGAAAEYARIIAARQRLGRPLSVLDAQIAAIALSARATLATRNLKDFDHLGLTLVNPYERS